ncbi:hypothetical protein KCU67_g16579, partial [Aureobasidium melanogenum]
MKKALHKLVPGHRRSTSASGNYSNSDSGTPTSASRASTDMTERPRASMDAGARPSTKARFASPRNSTSIDTRKSVDHHNRASTDLSHRRQSRSTSHHRATHSPLGAFRQKLRRGSSSSSSSDDRPLNSAGEPMSKAQLRKRQRLLQKEEKHKKAEEHSAADRKLQQQTQARAEADETGDMKAKYGVLPL